MKRMNRKERKEQRRVEAKARQAASDALRENQKNPDIVKGAISKPKEQLWTKTTQ